MIERNKRVRSEKTRNIVKTSLGIREIPPGFVVHHLDGNPMNNSRRNLTLIPEDSHTTIHKDRGFAVSKKQQKLEQLAGMITI